LSPVHPQHVAKGKHVGSRIVLKYCREYKPRYALFGHIHEAKGKLARIGNYNTKYKLGRYCIFIEEFEKLISNLEDIVFLKRELLVIDDELCSIVRRGLEGIRVDDDSLAIEQIKQVATSGKSYLSLKHTAKNTRKEIFVPLLSDRDRRGIWQRAGAKEIMDRAKEKVEQILKNQKGPGLDEDVEKKLNEYFKLISTRTYDDYRKLEGMEGSDENINLPNETS